MSERRTHLFYGWWVVLTAASGLCLGYAPIFVYSFGVFLKSLIAHFHSSRTSISLAFTLANVMQSVGAPLAGRLVDRLGPRKVILPSTLVFGLVLISFESFSTSLWQLYVLFIILGFIGTGTAPVPYGIVVSRWFDQRRGLALGLMLVGVSSGAIAMPSVAQRLISLFGWRATYSILGFAVLAVSVPVVGIFLKNSPAEIGTTPDGATLLNSRPERRSDLDGLTWPAARQEGSFWLMACAFFLVGTSVHACVIHLVPMLTDRGISAEKAALASSLLGVALLLGRVFSGYFLDRFFGPHVAIFLFGGVACGISCGSGHGSRGRHYCLSDKSLFWPSLVWRDLWLYVRRVHLCGCTGSSVDGFWFRSQRLLSCSLAVVSDGNANSDATVDAARAVRLSRNLARHQSDFRPQT